MSVWALISCQSDDPIFVFWDVHVDVGRNMKKPCLYPLKKMSQQRIQKQTCFERSIFKRSKWIHFKRIVDCSALMYWRRLKVWRWWWVTCRLSILINSKRHWWTIWVVQNWSSGSWWCKWIISRCLEVFIKRLVKLYLQMLTCRWYIGYMQEWDSVQDLNWMVQETKV